jgi:hypothetical protein
MARAAIDVEMPVIELHGLSCKRAMPVRRQQGLYLIQRNETPQRSDTRTHANERARIPCPELPPVNSAHSPRHWPP